MNNQLNATSMVTGQVILTFPHLFTAYANQPGQDPKISSGMLIPKSDIETKRLLDACVEAAALAGVAGKWNGVRPNVLQSPIWDGDGLRKNGEPFGPEYKGYWVLNASSKNRQQIVDINIQPILDQSEIYGGVYARVSINFYPYLNSSNKGIGCGLGPVQKLADGQPLGKSKILAETVFGGAAAFSQPAQQYDPITGRPV